MRYFLMFFLLFLSSLDLDSTNLNVNKNFKTLSIADEQYSIYLYFRDEKYFHSIQYFNSAIANYKKINKYEEIIKSYQSFLLFLQKNYPFSKYEQAIAYSQLAYYSKQIRNFEKGLEYEKKTLDILQTFYINDHLNIAYSYDNLSFYYKLQREYTEALEHKKNALTLYKSLFGKLHKSLALSYSDVGTLYLLLGELSESLKNFKTAFFIYNRELGENHPATLATYFNIGSIYLKIGNFQKALNIYENTLERYKKIVNIENEQTALIYENIGAIYVLLKEYDKAWLNLDKSLLIKEHYFGKGDIRTAGNYHSLGILAFYMKEYEKAIKYTNRSTFILEKTKYHDNLSSNYHSLGKIYQSLANYSESLKYYNKALLLGNKVFGEQSFNQISIYKSMGELYNLIGKKKESFHFSKKAFNLFIKEKEDIFLFTESSEKENYLQNSKSFINILLLSAYKLNNDLIAFNSWLKYKGSLFNSENIVSVLYHNTNNKFLKEDIKKLMINNRFLANLYNNIPQNKERWKEEIERTKLLISSVNQKISEKFSIFQEEQGLKSIDYKDITKNLKNSELYIDYAKAGDYYYIFTLDKQENIEFIQIDENRTKEIDALVMSFRDEVQSIIDDKIINKTKLKKLTQSSKEKLARLYALLIKNPLRGQLKSKSSLIFSPDGALRLFPFETLYDEEKQEYLIESKEIRYIPSGKELVRLYKYAKNRVPTKENVMVFANPNFDSNETAPYHESIALTRGTNENIIKPFFQKIYEPLRGTKLEADAIKETIENVEVFEWNRANETNLLNVQEPKILHIATHGFFINAPNIPNPMLKSGIILSGANKSAREKQGYGRITALKLSGLNLKNTDLVVLSACDTGVVDINNTDSISGLGKAFIQAGAKDVLMSLWSVDDNATKELMVSFYKQIKENPNYALALKEAKLKMIAEDMHPFYWGGFVVLGL